MLKEEQANGASCLANFVAGLDFTILKSSVPLSVLERAAVSRRYIVNVVDLLLLATQIINVPFHRTVKRRIGVADYITGNYSVTARYCLDDSKDGGGRIASGTAIEQISSSYRGIKSL